MRKGQTLKTKPSPDDAGRYEQALADYEGPLVRYAWRLTGDLDRARDVVQETFLRLHRQGIGTFDGQSEKLAAWLFAVCRHRALDVIKKERRMTRLDAAATELRVSPEPPSDASAERREETGKLLRLLAGLPPREQEVLRLKFQEALAYRQIAEVMGLSVSNVGFLIHRGLTTLRERVNRTTPLPWGEGS